MNVMEVSLNRVHYTITRDTKMRDEYVCNMCDGSFTYKNALNNHKNPNMKM